MSARKWVRGWSLGLAGGALGLSWLVRKARASRATLAGDVALVTGGSRGLGFLVARDLAREGCRLVICARDEQELERARAALAARGADVLALRCDVSDAG